MASENENCDLIKLVQKESPHAVLAVLRQKAIYI